MKTFAIMCSVAWAIGASAQVNIDKPLILTGSGTDARVGGIQAVTAPTDAVSASALQQGQILYAPAAGAADAIVLTLSPAPSSYTAGMLVHFRCNAANTGPVTLNVNGLGVRSIKKAVSADLGSGDFQPGQMVSVIYDGAAFQWLCAPSSGGGSLPPGACFTSTNPVSPPGYSRGGQTSVHTSGWTVETTPPALSGWGSFGRSMAVWNGKIYLFGGDTYGENDKAFEYDPASDSWTPRATMTGRGRGNTAAVTVGNKIYVIGGQHPSLNTVAWVDEYDPVADTWTIRADMPTHRRYMSAASVGGKVYVFGGGNFSTVDVVEEYDPGTNSWATRTPMPSAREYMTAIPYGGLIYVIGGSDGWGPVGEALAYDPSADAWTTLNSPPASTNLSFSGGVVGSKIYLAAGAALWEYDPAADTWLIRNPPPQNVSYFIPAASVGGKVYLMDTSYNMAFDPALDRTVYTHCPD